MKSFLKFLNIFGPFLALFIVYAIFFVQARESFATVYNTKTVMQQSVVIGIAALGATVIIIGAGIDLSVGSMAALATVLTAQILQSYGAGGDIGIMLPILAGLAAIAACSLCGLLNGAMIAYLRIVPFIVTLGTMQIFRGTAKWIAGATTVRSPPTWLRGLMIVEPRPGAWWSVAPGLWLLAGMTAVFWAMLRYTKFGRHVFAVGSNEATARLCGINVGLNRVWVYMLGGMTAGVSGILSFTKLNVGDPNASIGFELDVIAAVVIGGGSFSGGQGGVVGSVIGAVIIAMLRNGCVMVGVKDHVQNIVIGTIIIVAVGLDQLKRRKQS